MKKVFFVFKYVYLSLFYVFYFKNIYIIILFYYGNVLCEKKICKWWIFGMGYYDCGCLCLIENGRVGRMVGNINVGRFIFLLLIVLVKYIIRFKCV